MRMGRSARIAAGAVVALAWVFGGESMGTAIVVVVGDSEGTSASSNRSSCPSWQVCSRAGRRLSASW